MYNQTKNLEELNNRAFFKKLKALPYVESIWANVVEGQMEPGKYYIDLAVYCPKANEEEWLAVMAIIKEADTASKVHCLRLDALKDSSTLQEHILWRWVHIFRSDDKR